MAAGEAQRVYDADPSKRAAICDLHGDVRWHDLWDGNPILAKPDDVAAGEQVHRITNGVGCRPYAVNPWTRQSGITFTDWRARDHRGKLYLTPSEIATGQVFRELVGPYWVIEPSPSRQSNPNKQWPWSRFVQVVQAQGPTWVQMIHADSKVLGRVELVSSPSFRAACAILAHAEGFLGTEGGLSHAAAALGIPAVVIFGGCMSVETFGYPEHVNLVNDGPESPCGRWLPCEHCQAAMERISVQRVVDAVTGVAQRQC